MLSCNKQLLNDLATKRPPLFEKPRPVNSGKPLGSKVVVQHRSDMLMQEQIINVKNVQDALERAMTELEKAKDKDEVIFHETRVKQLTETAQEMVLLLKLVHKLNTELAYARATLQKALKTGSEINTARKRVGWLEDRMEQLLGRRKQGKMDNADIAAVKGIESAEKEIYSILPAKPSSRLPPSEQPPDAKELLQHMDAGYLADYNTTNIFEAPLEHGVLTQENTYHYTPPVMDAKSQKALAAGVRRQITSPEGTPNDARLNAGRTKNKKRKKKKEIADLYPEGTEVTHYPPSTRSTQQRQTSMEMESQTASRENHDVEPGDVLDVVADESPEVEEGDDTIMKQPSEQSSLVPALQITPAKTESPRSTGSVQVTPRSETGHGDEETGRGEHLPPVFVTEGSYVSSGTKQSRGSRVTIKTPEELDEVYSDRYSPEGNRDEPMEYWNSEHHRFEYSDLNAIIDDFDPTSYHQMGIAVPGTFVDDKGQDLPAKLPWRAVKKATEITDVHQIALDKLSVKVHKMFEKVQDAAMLSVDPHYKDVRSGGPTLLQNFEAARRKDQDMSAPPTGSQSPRKDAASETAQTSVSLPSLRKERLGSSMSGRLVYYPKPLELPKKLPVTKTVRSKEFPKNSESISESRKLGRPPAERIVDQRNLFEETKFTSTLYKPKKKPVAPVTNEHKLRELLAQDTAESGARAHLRAAFSRAKTMVSITDDEMSSKGGLWKTMKPQSGALDHSGLKWERVKGIVHNQLLSVRVEDRVTACRQLGALRCGDTMVIYALRERAIEDAVHRVQYEAAKALIALGCWDNDILEVLLDYLEECTDDIRLDVVKALAAGKNIQFVDKRMDIFPELVHTLSTLCTEDDHEDALSFQSAVCLSKLCVIDNNAKHKLRQVINNTKDTHVKAQALEMLVRQQNISDEDVFNAILDQLSYSPVWKYRRDAAKLLILLGSQHFCVQNNQDKVYMALEKRLWDEPNPNVRQESAKGLAALEMFAKACGQVEKNLDDQNEMKRAQAVISLGTLGMKNERITRILLEMLELDVSEFVRLMVMRTLGMLQIQDNRVIRALRDKERGSGAMAKEARKALEALNIAPSQSMNKVMSWLDT